MKSANKTARPCPFCPKTFSVEGLKTHLISEHLDLPKSKEDKPNFRCERCDKNFKLEKNYKRHIISLHENENKENEAEVFNDEIKVIESAIKGNDRRKTLGTPQVGTRASKRRQSLPLASKTSESKLNSPLDLKNERLKLFNGSKGIEAKQGNGTPQVRTRTSKLRQSLPSALKNPKLNSPLALKNERLTKLLATNSITLIKDQRPSVPTTPTVPSKWAAILNSKSISITKSPNVQPSRTPNSSVQVVPPKTKGLKPKTSLTPNAGSFTFKCKTCQREFNQVKALQLHMKVLHSAKYPCKNCKKVFANPIDLKNHVTRSCFKAYQETNKSGTIVAKKKKTNFDCGSCGKSFTNLKFLENHAKAFHKGLTFHCFKCGNNYENFSKLLSHISLNHKTSKADICSWTCPKCDQHFDKELALLIHMGISHPGMKSTEVVKKPKLTKNPRILTSDKQFQSKDFQPQIQLKRLSKKEIEQWKQ